MSQLSYKDYYAILGVGRNATEKEIKSAYKKLARQHHPDVNPGDKESEHRFQDINEAYEVLGDKENREKYDRFGSQWKHASAGRGGAAPGGGAPFDFDFNFDFGQGGGGGGGGFSSFFEQMFSGGGRNAPRATKGGVARAEIEVSLEEAFAGVSRTLTLSQSRKCPSCGGVGVSSNGVCPACRGQGTATTERRLEVKIPAGVTEGSQIRVRGEGEPGRHGGPPGDLYLTVKLRSHPRYEVKGRDLYVDVPVPFYRAALGGKVTVSTLKGDIELKVPPGSQGDKKLRLTGFGLPGSGGKKAGNLYARLRLTLPEEITPEMTELMEQFAKLSGERVS